MDAETKFREAQRTLERLLSYPFYDEDLLREALYTAEEPVHSVRAATNAGSRSIPEANRRMAIVGAGAVQATVACRMYERKNSEAEIKAFLDQVADKNFLANIGFALGIDKLLTNEPFKAGVSDKTMKRAVEAILGAVFEDSNRRVEIVEKAMNGLECFNAPQAGVFRPIAFGLSSSRS